MILDGSGMRKENFEIVIPPPPVIDTNAQFDTKIIELNARAEAIPELEQRFVDEVSSENRVKRTPVTKEMPEKHESEPEPTPAPAIAVIEPAKVGGISWVLQVGSFQDRNKALVQRDRLRKSNIAAVFIEQFNVNNKPSYRVRLGPFINREQTRVAQNKIKAKHDIDGIIMKYER
jgi:DedD protein